MKKYSIYMLLLLASFTSYSQDVTKPKKWHYFGHHTAGILSGSSQDKYGVLTTNGVRKGNWYTGLSTGLDWYGIRSIPLLASVHKAFGNSKHQPFLWGNGGLSFAWERSANFFEGYNLSSSSYKPGFMTEAGIGYFISLKNKTALSISAGYSYKALALKGTYNSIVIAPNNYYTTEFVNNYHYRRIAIRVGIKM